MTALERWLDEHEEELVALRRAIHAHPEPSGAEHATTDLVRQRLELAGLAPRVLTSGTGLICDVGPSNPQIRPQRRLALRADLDALAMHDEKDVPYRSQVDGVAHACGHDVHTTVMLGAAVFAAHHPDLLAAPLRFIFQPAEERVPGGALDVLADGGLEDVDAIVGIHCEPKLDVGLVGVRDGAISSAADMVTIRLTGPGGHTARPELTVDLIAVAARLATVLPARVAELVDELDDEVGAGDVKFVFGAIHGGDAANVIPTTCELRASVRTPSLAVWESLPGLVDKAIAEHLAGTGAGHEVEYVHGVPPVVNDAGVAGIVRAAATREFGSDAVRTVEQSWGGDDFAWFTREVSGAYVRVGVHDPDGPQLDLHAGHFDVDERSIRIGIRLVHAVIEQFGIEQYGIEQYGDL